MGALLSLAATSALLLASTSAFADPITVHVGQPGAKISPMLYGLMTEEINYSYDGGLYAELIQNRIFRNPVAIQPARRGGRGRGAPPATNATAAAPAPVLAPPNPIPHWTAVTKGAAQASVATDTANPVNTTALTTALKLSIAAVAPGERAGVANDGYWGIPVKPSTTYTASFYAKSADGFSGPLTVDIESADGATVYATGTVDSVGAAWKKYTLKLETAAAVKPTADTRFVISGTSKGSVWFNLVSLFPPTYKDRPNGNRVDIMQLLADMHPAFLRFPGGNFVEGPNFANRFNWKETIGPLEDRPGHEGSWGPQDQPKYRPTDGMGLLEFCEWCEDLNMEPLLAVWACYTLNGQSTPATDYPKYAQEALEEIEYVTGDASTTWGARRIKDGHPAPFPLHYVEIGNEDNFDRAGTYDARFTVFYDAIKAKYPSLKVIATTGVRTRTADLIDEHHYNNVTQSITLAQQYATRRPNPNTKVFVGEWATRDNRPTVAWDSGLADGIFLTGLERNPNLVVLSCYAPLFVNVNQPYPQSPGGPDYPIGQQWATDLIGYDALNSFGGTGYYTQKLFYSNAGETVLPFDLAATDLWASCTRDTKAGEVILKLISRRDAATPMDITLDGVTTVDKNAAGWVLTGAATDVNNVANPTKVAPKELKIDNAAAKFTYALPPMSLTVLRIKAK